MKIFLRSRGFRLTPDMDADARQSLLEELWSLGGKISRVDLHLTDTRPGRKRKPMRATVRVQLRSGATLLVDVVERNVSRAIAIAARRACRMTRKEVRRQDRAERRQAREQQRSSSPWSYSLT